MVRNSVLGIGYTPRVMTCRSRVRPFGAFLFAFLAVTALAAAAETVVEYDIEVTLEPERHRLTGRESIRWTNTTSAATDEVRFHLYLNAFASSKTTFMTELAESELGHRRQISTGWGWVRVLGLWDGDGADLLAGADFVRPDDGNPEDFTVLRVPLGREVVPGSSVSLEVDFEAKLPWICARTGHVGDFHFVGQWYPKLGVFEDAGIRGRAAAGWNCPQFHAASEFYADFAAYRVVIVVPARWVVAATGVEVERSEVEDGASQRVVVRAHKIHDFAWCAAPPSLMTMVEDDFEPGRDVPGPWLESASDLLALSPSELELPPTHIRLMLPRTQLGLKERMLASARAAIAWYGLFYGPYADPQLTIVSPPPGAEWAWGMEYPTLITTGASRLMDYPPLAWFPWIEMVTVHEFGHQYFYGLLGSNEFEEAWLDEGLTSYTEAACLEDMAAQGKIPSRLAAAPWAALRLGAATLDLPQRLDLPAWKYRTMGDYFRTTYDRGALVLRTLEGLIGSDRFARAMRAYVETYRYDHPTIDDLVAVFSDEVGENLDWFFTQAVRSDATPDWAVVDVRHRKLEAARGLIRGPDGWQPRENAIAGSEDGDFWQAVVDIGRVGEFTGPVEVAVFFEGGRSERRTWDSNQRWVRFTFEGPQPIEGVVVDPDGVWALETRRLDNYWQAAPRRRPVRDIWWWLRESMQLLHLLHLPWS